LKLIRLCGGELFPNFSSRRCGEEVDSTGLIKGQRATFREVIQGRQGNKAGGGGMFGPRLKAGSWPTVQCSVDEFG
jgi:hypothetical protein